MNNFKKMIFSIITLGLAIGVVVTFIFKDHQILQHNSDVEIQPEAIEEEHLANQKVMYLTFDDGPSEYTKKFLQPSFLLEKMSMEKKIRFVMLPSMVIRLAYIQSLTIVM